MESGKGEWVQGMGVMELKVEGLNALSMVESEKESEGDRERREENRQSRKDRERRSKRKKGKNYSTSYSRVISHHSTDDAITSLTSEIGRDPVLSSVYGRS